jgi:hypothetical protein
MYYKTIFTTLLTMLFLAGSLMAQERTLTIQETPEMKIDGDANVRSWDADIEAVDGQLILQNSPELTLDNLTAESIKELRLTIKVEDITSDSRRLTRNLQDYLKGDDYPEITFTLNEVTDIEKENDSAQITAEGVINAAGQDHNVTMNVTATMNNDGSIRFRGEQDLLMTDFGIEPPTAVMGTVRARDEIKISYDVTFQ